ncbi:hypothetical protein TrRE_jg3900 [Triparma retinervis]|uniref:STI1/HOP DP domain-containing protein n=1 Tax=Triparma retinervis TaxID=2557542 RepID=A0A9W6ZW68_9STRA|nr:hypothetical protein TrRE_jg3900 [Triparma retinervis]
MTLDDMKAKDMKKELTLRGVSTDGLFEKSDLKEALKSARSQNVERVDQFTQPADSPAAAEPSPQSPPSSTSDDLGNMKVGELKSELDSYCVSYADLFEKSEFVDRVRQCRSEGREKVRDIMGMMGNMGNMGNMGGGGGGMQEMAQKIMQNPKAQGIIAKAQKNPKIMSAVTECMGNPAAFAKYQNDPEIKEILDELRSIM